MAESVITLQSNATTKDSKKIIIEIDNSDHSPRIEIRTKGGTELFSPNQIRLGSSATSDEEKKIMIKIILSNDRAEKERELKRKRRKSAMVTKNEVESVQSSHSPKTRSRSSSSASREDQEQNALPSASPRDKDKEGKRKVNVSIEDRRLVRRDSDKIERSASQPIKRRGSHITKSSNSSSPETKSPKRRGSHITKSPNVTDNKAVLASTTPPIESTTDNKPTPPAKTENVKPSTTNDDMAPFERRTKFQKKPRPKSTSDFLQEEEAFLWRNLARFDSEHQLNTIKNKYRPNGTSDKSSSGTG